MLKLLEQRLIIVLIVIPYFKVEFKIVKIALSLSIIYIRIIFISSLFPYLQAAFDPNRYRFTMCLPSKDNEIASFFSVKAFIILKLSSS